MARPTVEEWAMHMALVTASRSTCLRKSVGCVLLNKQGQIIATGYNGVARGLPHCNYEEWEGIFPYQCKGAFCEGGDTIGQCFAIHAEQNALLQCRNVEEIDRCIVTLCPCITCAKLLLNTSCTTIIYNQEYRLQAETISLWRGANRKIIHLPINGNYFPQEIATPKIP